MNLVNTNGMSLLGPGSEWFWGAVQAVIIGITLIFIRQQLTAMKMATRLGEMRKLEQRWESLSIAQARLSTAIGLRDSPDQPMTREARSIAEVFSDIYALRDRGVISEREVMEAWASRCDGWWVLLGPTVDRFRTAESSKKLYLGFQELAKSARKKARKWGYYAGRIQPGVA
jgi:hypothetical protein